MNERFKAVRLALSLSQEAFGDKIGIKGSGISNIESGIRSVSERHVRLLCSVYGVSENWLRTGDGEMFASIGADDPFDTFCRNHGLNDSDAATMRAFIQLPPASRAAIYDFIRSMANSLPAQSDIDIADRIITEQLKGQR